MLLAVDVGNTQTVFGLFAATGSTEHWRVATEAHRTGRRARPLLRRLPRPRGAWTASASRSTVPALVHEYEAFAERSARRRSSARPGRANRHPDPVRRSPRGRARTGSRTPWPPRALRRAVHRRRLRHVDELRRRLGRKANIVGGVLAPGIEVSMDALFARAARLPKVILKPPSVIGQSTVSALQSGLVYGFAGQVDGIVERIRAELAPKPGCRHGRPGRFDRPALAHDHGGGPWLTLRVAAHLGAKRRQRRGGLNCVQSQLVWDQEQRVSSALNRTACSEGGMTRRGARGR